MGNENKQTAVEWLYEQIKQSLLTVGYSGTKYKMDIIKKQALKMEKQQIIDAFVEGYQDTSNIDLPNENYSDIELAKDYYNRIYNT